MDAQEFLTTQEIVAIGEFKRRLNTLFHYQRFVLLLWGDRARGDSGLNANIRLVVIGPDVDRRRRRRIIDALVAVETEFLAFFSIRVFSNEEFEILKRRERRLPYDIEREGIPL